MSRSRFGLRDGAARIVSGRSGRSDRCGLWGTINNVGSSVDRSRRFALPFWHGPVVCVCCPLIASGMRMMDPEPDGMTLSEEDRRLVGLWAADCAERVLPLFQAKAPSDTRPRQAVEGTRAFALGGRRAGQLRSLAWAAHAAAREVGDPVATAAARVAPYAAATPYIHALTTLHQAPGETRPWACDVSGAGPRARGGRRPDRR